MSSLKVTPAERKKRPYAWLIFLVVLSGVLITASMREGTNGPLNRARVAVQTVTTPIGQAGKWVATPVRDFSAWIRGLGVSRSELDALRKQNADLRSQVSALTEQMSSSRSDAALKAAAESAGYKGVTADVIGLPVDQGQQVIVVSAGSAKNVKTSMPVLGPNGLLGQVIAVGPNYAKVRLITDQESGIATLLQNSRAQGITSGSLSGALTMNFVGMDAQVTAGDTVITSGLGGVFPKGLIVGQVSKVGKEVNSLYKVIQVKPANDMGRVEKVIILTDTPPDVNDTVPAPQSSN